MVNIKIIINWQKAEKVYYVNDRFLLSFFIFLIQKGMILSESIR